jgi:hypothetical protein
MRFPPKPVPTPNRPAQKTVLSPVGEPLGETVKPKHHVDDKQIRSETDLEVGSSY